MDRASLLVSDLDGTLIGDDEALVWFADWYQANQNRLRLVYATGRFFPKVIEATQTSPLPQPEAVLGAVGTEIRDFASSEVLQAWHDQAPASWNAERVRHLLADVEGLEPQPSDLQSPFKVSYYLHEAGQAQLDALGQRLSQAGIDADIIYSSRRDLDVLPKGFNKGTATAFLARRWQIDPARVMVAGDTGNDLALFGQGFRGIVVGNAHDELKALSSPNIYQAQASYAAGVLEGIQHWLTAY